MALLLCYFMTHEHYLMEVYPPAPLTVTDGMAYAIFLLLDSASDGIIEASGLIGGTGMKRWSMAAGN